MLAIAKILTCESDSPVRQQNLCFGKWNSAENSLLNKSEEKLSQRLVTP